MAPLHKQGQTGEPRPRCHGPRGLHRVQDQGVVGLVDTGVLIGVKLAQQPRDLPALFAVAHGSCSNADSHVSAALPALIVLLVLVFGCARFYFFAFLRIRL